MSRLEYYRAEFRDIRHSAGYVLKDIAELWPLVWRTTADRRSEQTDRNAFDLGREWERDDAERRLAAPAVGNVYRITREAVGLTGTEVAALVDVEADYLERVEQGLEVAPVSLSGRLTSALGEQMGASQP